MGFGSIYWPVVCALITAFVITEAIHIGIGFWLAKRQEKKAREFQEQMQAQGIDPMMAALMGGGGMGAPPAFMAEIPAEGAKDSTKLSGGEKDGSGGYL